MKIKTNRKKVKSTKQRISSKKSNKYYAGKIVSGKKLKDKDSIVTLTKREYEIAEKRAKKKNMVDMDLDGKPDLILTKSETKRAMKRDWKGKKVSVDGKKSSGGPGYVVKNGRVHYRTKSGKEGSMPDGHVKMVSRWGLKEVDEL